MTREDAIAIVRDYLRRMEARDLDGAQGLLADHAKIVFPGGKLRRSAAEIAAGSAGRYQDVRKRIGEIDALEKSPGLWAVYCLGTLYGRWANGDAFEGVRFVDRFEVRAGRIVRQDVWNDAPHHQPPLPSR